MKVIGHKAVAANIYVELPGKLLQLVKKYFIMGAAMENLLPLVSPVDDMIACTGIFHS
jgi:hypothetical protein